MNNIIQNKGFNRLVEGRYGYCLYNHNDIFIGQAVERYGEYSESEVELFRQICKPGNIVMDIGANIGTHTMAMSQMVYPGGAVFSFEPQRIVFQTLCANMALNSIKNVECLPYLVSDTDGYGLVPEVDYDQENNFGGIQLGEVNRGSKVIRINLDSYFSAIPRLDFLKIDVEGMEYQVIQGGKKLISKFKPILYVENDKRDKSKYLIRLIKSLGYNLYWHAPILYNEDNFFGNKENIYPNVVSFNMFCLPDHIKSSLKGFKPIDDDNYHPMDEIKISDK